MTESDIRVIQVLEFIDKFNDASNKQVWYTRADVHELLQSIRDLLQLEESKGIDCEAYAKGIAFLVEMEEKEIQMMIQAGKQNLKKGKQ